MILGMSRALLSARWLLAYFKDAGLLGRPGVPSVMHTGPSPRWRSVAGATDVGAGYQFGRCAEVIGLDSPQFSGLLRLHQVVDAALPQQTPPGRFPQLDLDGPQQLTGLARIPWP